MALFPSGKRVIAEKLVQEAVMLLREAASPVWIILFGSYVRGEPSGYSDLDFLVVERELKARMREMVRLRRILRSLRIPVDVIVVSEKTFIEWASTPGSVIHEAAVEGKVVYDAS